MATTTAGVNAGISRVTVVAPTTRVDLALPNDVPLASLLPTLLQYAGDELADEGAAAGGWVLSRLGGKTLDSGRSPAQLGIRDGEVLYFTRRADAAQDLVFDDVVDAVATATQNRAGRWQTATTRRFALTLATLALLGGAAAVLTAGPPLLVAGIVGLAAALVLVVTATVLARAFGDGRASVLLGMVALAYATVGGLLVVAGNRTLGTLAAPHVLIAATALVVFAAIATVATGEATGLFVGATCAGVAMGLGAMVCLVFGARPAAAAAVVGAITFALLPALPMLAYRIARLPVPSVPTGPEDLKSDVETVDGRRILALADRADELLTGLIGTVAAVLLGAEVVMALTGGLAGVLLCAVLAVLLLLRSRPLPGRRQRLPLLVAGTVGVALVTTALFLAASPLLRVTVVPAGLLVVAVIALVYGLGVAGRRISPVWGRLLDIVELLLIVAVVPLAAWLCGLYGWIRAIGG